ncbi:hypothetical protein GCM10007877_14910 [Marinibactrum halimedae]|uniref:Serine protease n=1 Tax=Marinibactrum halimedae TaxID=1444977 RepID=A0AA37WP73_9GAMM|nr:hypothetical protein GCM10007877_14910 [Marinibactrum halimedae]
MGIVVALTGQVFSEKALAEDVKAQELGAVSESVQAQLDSARSELTRVAGEASTNLVLSSGEGVSTQEVYHPGAQFIKVHIDQLALSKGDKVVITGSEGQKQILKFRDNTAEGAWAISVMGDTATITLKQAKRNAVAGKGASINIDRYVHGYSNSEIAQHNPPVEETVCGRDDREEAACYRNSESAAFQASRAVARLVMPCNENGRGQMCTCTAWRVGPDSNTMITNNHCLADARQISRAEVRFNFQNSSCNGNNANSRQTIVTVDDILVTHYNLDMTLFTINNANSVARFGSLNLEDRRPQRGEEIYIPQHPGGRDKEIAIFSDQNGGDYCTIARPVTNGRGRNTDMNYNCDTEGGSSGSPVLLRSTNTVIGLHHFGRCNNRAVRIDRIADVVAPYL